MPWNHALDAGERESLLALLRKMIKAESERRSQATRARHRARQRDRPGRGRGRK